MSTLHDFRMTLSEDRADWLVLADWLEDHGDNRGHWVRFMAERNVGLTADSPICYLAQYATEERPLAALLGWIIKSELDSWSFRLPQAASPLWFDIVMSLASFHARWDSNRERLLGMLDDVLLDLVTLRLERHSRREICEIQGIGKHTLQRRLTRVRQMWKRALDTHDTAVH